MYTKNNISDGFYMTEDEILEYVLSHCAACDHNINGVCDLFNESVNSFCLCNACISTVINGGV